MISNLLQQVCTFCFCNVRADLGIQDFLFSDDKWASSSRLDMYVELEISSVSNGEDSRVGSCHISATLFGRNSIFSQFHMKH